MQSRLGGSYTDGYRRKNTRDKISDAAKPYITDLILNQDIFAPPPMVLIPNRYSIPNSFISAFSLSVPLPTTLDTPYRDKDNTVHSYIVEFPRPFRGYRYMMAITPYSSTQHENPLIYGTNDFVSFDLLDGMPQPLATIRPGDLYNFVADVALTYDPIEGDLICCWTRITETGKPLPAWGGFWYSRTKDGYSWTEPRLMKNVASGMPIPLYNTSDDLWHLWYLPNQGVIVHEVAPSIEGPWTLISSTNTNAAYGIPAWHFEVKLMGNKPVMLLNTAVPSENLYLGISEDWDTWTFGSPLQNPKQTGVYKASFLPEFNGDSLTLLLVWNTNNAGTPENSQKLFVNRTNTISISELV